MRRRAVILHPGQITFPEKLLERYPEVAEFDNKVNDYGIKGKNMGNDYEPGAGNDSILHLYEETPKVRLAIDEFQVGRNTINFSAHTANLQSSLDDIARIMPGTKFLKDYSKRLLHIKTSVTRKTKGLVRDPLQGTYTVDPYK